MSDDFNLSPNLVEALSWTLVSEFLRRYPKRYSLIQTHPGGGEYDCLALFNGKRPVADLNRAGRIHLWGEEHLILEDPWERMTVEGGSRKLLDELCKRLKLTIPKKLPAADSSTTLFRIVSAFLRMQVTDIHQWRCINGYLDTSGFGGGVISGFDLFPGVRERLPKSPCLRDFSDPAYSFWFLERDHEPVICLAPGGKAFGKDGKESDLVKRYRDTKNVGVAVADLIGLLP